MQHPYKPALAKHHRMCRDNALAVPLKRPVADSTYFRPTWVVPVVELATSDGIVGTGVGGVWVGHELICTTIDNYFAPQLLGRPSEDIRAIWHRLYWSDIHWVGRAGVVHTWLRAWSIRRSGISQPSA